MSAIVDSCDNDVNDILNRTTTDQPEVILGTNVPPTNVSELLLIEPVDCHSANDTCPPCATNDAFGAVALSLRATSINTVSSCIEPLINNTRPRATIEEQWFVTKTKTQSPATTTKNNHVSRPTII
jgi:hypothetical protein